MCLLSLNWLEHPVYKLILVTNRDEFYDRPSAPLHLWREGFYAGKDLKEGGTWLGFHEKGRFAALTNFRDPKNEGERTSRGELVSGFLKGDQTPIEYLKEVEKKMSEYNGFNLLVSDNSEMYYLSNYREGISRVRKGPHAISNAFLDTPWPKVIEAKKDLKALLREQDLSLDQLLKALQSQKHAPVELLPKTGLPNHLEKAVSSQFIQVEDYYGTVNTTALLWKHNGEVQIKERRVIPRDEEATFSFIVHPQLSKKLFSANVLI